MFRLNPTPKLNVPLSFAKGTVTAAGAGRSMALPLRLAKWQRIDFQPTLPINPFPFPAFYCVIQALSKCVTKHTSNALKTCFCSSQRVIQCKNHLNCTDCSWLGNTPEQTKGNSNCYRHFYNSMRKIGFYRHSSISESC